MADAKVILVMRDFRNWAASCLKRRDTARGKNELDVVQKLPQRAKLWMKHARLAIRNPSWLTVISFNQWFQDEEYRKRICAELCIPFTDEGLNEVMAYGNGSSFDARRYNGKAQDMGVLERWHDFEFDPMMKQLYTGEVKALDVELFGNG